VWGCAPRTPPHEHTRDLSITWSAARESRSSLKEFCGWSRSSRWSVHFRAPARIVSKSSVSVLQAGALFPQREDRDDQGAFGSVGSPCTPSSRPFLSCKYTQILFCNLEFFSHCSMYLLKSFSRRLL